jgi:hypothetical protein
MSDTRRCSRTRSHFCAKASWPINSPTPDPLNLSWLLLAIAGAMALTACGGGGGGDSAAPPPPAAVSVTFQSDQTSITSGASVTLTWAAMNATSCVASGSWSGSKAPTGSQTVGPLTQDSNFVLSCSNSSDTALPVTVNVTVIQPQPAPGIAVQMSSDAVNDAVWDSQRQVLYLAIGSAGSVMPNSVIAFDPETGTISNSIFAGSEPTTLAMSDDGQFLYVGLTGSDSIQRILLPQLTLDIRIPSDLDQRALTPIEGGQALFALQIAVAPGTPHTFGVARAVAAGSPLGGLGQTLVFDDAISRPYSIATTVNANSLAWGAEATTLYSGYNAGQGTQVGTIATGGGGFAVGTLSGSFLGKYPDFISYAAGRIYDNSGSALDALTLLPSANYQSAADVAVVDEPNNRIFYASTDGYGALKLSAYNLLDTTLIGATTLTNNGSVLVQGSLIHMVRWGSDGLALVTSLGQLLILSGPLVAPGGTDTPVGVIPGISVSGHSGAIVTPATTIVPTQAADMVWDPIRNLLYASIPSTAAVNPSSIIVVDPASGLVTSATATATSPSALAISDDGQYLYVGEVGAFARYKLPSMVLDFTVTNATWGAATPFNIAVAPATPHTVALAFNGSSVYVYDDAVPRGLPVTGGFIAWGADASSAYSQDTSSGSGGIYTYSVDATGLSQTKVISGAWFITLNPPQTGMTFSYAGGLLYSETGAVLNPVTQEIVGSLPIATSAEASSAIGPVVVDQSHNRAYVAACLVAPVNSACGDAIETFDLTTYTTIVIAGIQGVNGWAYRLLQMSPTSFALLTANGQIALVSSPMFSQ